MIKVISGEKAEMTKFLNEAVGVYMKDGRELSFKPIGFEGRGEPTNDTWKGIDDQGRNIEIKRKEIDFISHF